MIKVESVMDVYEVEGREDAKERNEVKVAVRSHWNCPDRVVLEMSGLRVTVLAKDLEAAIRNATNSARF